jgi:hypothetical protein
MCGSYMVQCSSTMDVICVALQLLPYRSIPDEVVYVSLWLCCQSLVILYAFSGTIVDAGNSCYWWLRACYPCMYCCSPIVCVLRYYSTLLDTIDYVAS